MVPNKIASTEIPGGTTEVTTLKKAGDTTITVKKSASGVTVDGANVVSADIKASNGIIHVIDKVILPSSYGLLSCAVR